MTDLNFQDLSTVQSEQQQGVRTIASAATIAPTTFLTLLSGTNDLATVTPPVTGVHMLLLTFTNANPGQIVETGNILLGGADASWDPGVNESVILVYNPDTAKYAALLLART
jgi:hypothetical protein